MSRRYRIEVGTTNASLSQVGPPVSAAFGTKAASSNSLPAAFQTFFPLDVLPDGKNVNASYLDLEFDLNSNSASSQNQGAQMLTIWGVTPQMVATVQQLNNLPITVYGGFANGMPLATAMAATGFNPLVSGIIYGAFGNRKGTDIYICLPIIPNNGVSIRDPNGDIQTPNLTMDGKKGELWGTVITRSITQAMPNAQYLVDVRPELILSEDNQGTGYSLDAIGQIWISEANKILGNTPNYMGIMVYWKGNKLIVTDNPNVQGSKNVTIKAEQLMDNPTASNSQQLQLTCPMRSDIYIGDTVTVPQDVLALAQSNAQFGQNAVGTTPNATAANSATVAALAGSYTVTGVRHMGRSRATDAGSWASIFDITYLESSKTASQVPVNDGSQPFGQKTQPTNTSVPVAT
jgi:hypothetical protein